MPSPFTHLPLGARIPGSVHSVSCSLPTMDDVCGYEERREETLRAVPSAYPRFVVHPFARQLAASLAAGVPELRGKTVWLTSSAKMATHLEAWLAGAGHAKAFTSDGIAGVAHDESAEVFGQAKLFLQHVGGYLSSREAEDLLVARGLAPAIEPEALHDGDGLAAVKATLRRVLPGAADRDVFLANCGMNAVFTAFSAISAVQAPRGRTVWLQVGWLYLDTIAILQKFTQSPADYVFVRDVTDSAAIERLFVEYGPRLAGVVAEVPTNPLVQTPDVPKLAALCRQHGARLIIDPSISSIFNIDALPHADIVVNSLTKYTASDGDMVLGLVAVNPAGPDADTLRTGVTEHIETAYTRDVQRLAHEIVRTNDVLARIHENTPRVVSFLEQHPAVDRVYWALSAESRPNYLQVARHDHAIGGLVTFTLKEEGSLARVYDRLRLPKGPSFGMATTLICPFMFLAHYDMVTTQPGRARLRADGLDPDLLRLSVGSEPVEDIIEVLGEALG
jgi:cystathionine gamma-synthase